MLAIGLRVECFRVLSANVPNCAPGVSESITGYTFTAHVWGEGQQHWNTYMNVYFRLQPGVHSPTQGTFKCKRGNALHKITQVCGTKLHNRDTICEQILFTKCLLFPNTESLESRSPKGLQALFEPTAPL